MSVTVTDYYTLHPGRCHRLAGIDPSSYHAEADSELLDAFWLAFSGGEMWRYHIDNCNFKKLWENLQSRGEWKVSSTDLFFSFPGTRHIPHESGFYALKSAASRQIWLIYHPAKERLYIGIFFH